MGKVKVLTGVIGKGKGGMSLFAVGLFERLDPEKFDVTFLTNDPEPYFGKEILAHGGHLAYIPSRLRHPLAHKKALRKILREGKFDVCHIHLSTASNIDPLIEAHRAGVPKVIAHSHNTGVEGNALARLLHGKNASKIRKYTTARLACSKLAGEFMYAGADFTVVKNAIDLDRFAYSPETRKRMREELNFGDKLAVGHIGRMSMQKNPRYLLETFRAVKALEPESVFCYVGDGPMEEEIRRYAGELGILSDIVFTGQVPNPQDYLCAFDCFLLPSLFEGLGFVVIESACSGLLCFASDVIPEEARVCDLVQTFSLSEKPETVAQRIVAQRQDPAVRVGQGERLRELGYDFASQKRQIEAIYTGERSM